MNVVAVYVDRRHNRCFRSWKFDPNMPQQHKPTQSDISAQSSPQVRNARPQEVHVQWPQCNAHVWKDTAYIIGRTCLMCEHERRFVAVLWPPQVAKRKNGQFLTLEIRLPGAWFS